MKVRQGRRESEKDRKWTRKYTLKDAVGAVAQVCSHFFHSTLGYKNTHVTDWVFKKLEETASGDRKGSHDPAHKMSMDLKNRVVSHWITSSNCEQGPCTPETLFRPFVNNTKDDRYVQGNLPTDKNKLHSYRRVFKEQNISFIKLWEEECEECEIHKQHMCSKDQSVLAAKNKQKSKKKQKSANKKEHDKSDTFSGLLVVVKRTRRAAKPAISIKIISKEHV